MYNNVLGVIVLKLKKYICDFDFLKMVLAIALPVVFQQIVETFVSLADSMMVSSYSEIGVSAVQIGSQWEEIAFLLSFGICSGVGIYIAQFYGKEDIKNMRKSFGTMILMSVIFSLPFILIALFFPDVICGFYIKDTGVVDEASIYLMITSLSYFFVLISACFNYTYRCMKLTKITMLISSMQVLLNCFLNYLLIFGNFGFPTLGIAGAALATTISRGLGMITYVIFSVASHQVFIGSFKEMFKLDVSFLKPVLKRIAPTVANEGMFGIGQSLFFKAFGALGVSAVTAVSIANKISNIFFVAIWALCSALQSIVGNTLGKNDLNKAKVYADYFMGLGFVFSLCLGIIMIVTRKVFVFGLYGNEAEAIKQAATMILVAYALKFALRLFNAFIFGLLRAGGDTKVLAILDSVILYVVGIPLAFACVYVFKLGVVETIIIIQLEQVVRIILAFKRYLSGKWCKNVTGDVG